MIAVASVLGITFTWILSGSIKFVWNSLRNRHLAFRQIGLGGFPSTHTAVATFPAALMLLMGSANDTAFALAFAFLIIVCIDALDTRMRLGRVTNVVAEIAPHLSGRLRHKTGHSLPEVLGGVCTGAGSAALVTFILKWFE